MTHLPCAVYEYVRVKNLNDPLVLERKDYIPILDSYYAIYCYVTHGYNL